MKADDNGSFVIKEVGVEDDVISVDVELRGPLAVEYGRHRAHQQILRSMDIVAECRRQLPNPEVEVVRGIVQAFYARAGNGAGGRLHVQLDDGNLEDDFLTTPIDDDEEAEALRRVLLAMTLRQRLRVFTGEGPTTIDEMREVVER